MATSSSKSAKPASPLDPRRAEQPVGRDLDDVASCAERDTAAGGAAVRKEADRKLTIARDKLGSSLDTKLKHRWQVLPNLACGAKAMGVQGQFEAGGLAGLKRDEAGAPEGCSELTSGHLGLGAWMIELSARHDKQADQADYGDHHQQFEEREATLYQLTTSRFSPSPPSTPSAPRLARS